MGCCTFLAGGNIIREYNRIKKRIIDALIVLIIIGYVFYGTYPKHADFWVMNYVAKSFAMGVETQKLPQNLVAYPPDWYIIQGTYIKLLSIIFSYDLRNWPVDMSTAPSFMPLFVILPNIILFFIGAILIFKIYKRKELVLAYMASPLAFISIEVMGQIDIYPAFFTLISLYFAKQAFDTDRQFWKIASIISLGIGAQFKLYTLLLLVPMSIFLANKKMRTSFELIFLGIIISLIPWAVYTEWFKLIVIGEKSSWFFNLQLAPVNLPPYHTISIWFIGYSIILWMLKYIKVHFKNLIMCTYSGFFTFTPLT